MTQTCVAGVEVVPLQRFADARGTVFHMLKATDPHFVGFGEIYFSSVYPGVIKGWKRHRRMTVNYACILGRLKLVLYDDRDGSSTSGALTELFISPDEYALVVIPPWIWHGFQGASHPAAIVANCTTEPSDPAELDRLDAWDESIPYNWNGAPR
jgi:dTDP-4-dehydrorhamnose 3,5-epimerase